MSQKSSNWTGIPDADFAIIALEHIQANSNAANTKQLIAQVEQHVRKMAHAIQSMQAHQQILEEKNQQLALQQKMIVPALKSLKDAVERTPNKNNAIKAIDMVNSVISDNLQQPNSWPSLGNPGWHKIKSPQAIAPVFIAESV